MVCVLCDIHCNFVEAEDASSNDDGDDLLFQNDGFGIGHSVLPMDHEADHPYISPTVSAGCKTSFVRVKLESNIDQDKGMH